MLVGGQYTPHMDLCTDQLTSEESGYRQGAPRSYRAWSDCLGEGVEGGGRRGEGEGGRRGRDFPDHATFRGNSESTDLVGHA